MTRADTALYSAKAAGRNCVYRHTGDLRAVVQSIVEETRESVEQSARTYKI